MKRILVFLLLTCLVLTSVACTVDKDGAGTNNSESYSDTVGKIPNADTAGDIDGDTVEDTEIDTARDTDTDTVEDTEIDTARDTDTDTAMDTEGDTAADTDAPKPTNELRWIEIDGEKYLQISAVKKTQDQDSSKLFLTEFEGEEVKGYYIEDGIYSVDAETMHRIVKMPFEGNGAIRYLGYKVNDSHDPSSNFDGILHISRMDDPLYVFTCLPNERSFQMEKEAGRYNASVLYDPTDDHVKVLPIGAAYINPKAEIPDDAPITICLGTMIMAVKWEGEAWQTVYEDLPAKPTTLYYLPWKLEGELGKQQLDPSKVKIVEDSENGEYIEISLTGKELKNAMSDDPRIEGMTFHFWGKENYMFTSAGRPGSELEGVAVSFEIWVKEPEAENYLTCAIGADLRDANGKINQVFTGIGYAVTNEPRFVFGHNVGVEKYDEVMHTRDVQDILGITD